MAEQNKSNKAIVKKSDPLARDPKPLPADFEEFVLWFAMPLYEKVRLGIETQAEFAELHGVHANTLTNWKKAREFYPRLQEIRNIWAKDRTQDVIAALYRGAIGNGQGSPRDRELWLKYVEGWTEDAEKQKVTKVELTPGDIRFLIEGLPEPYQTQAYEHLRDITDLIADHGSVQHLKANAAGIYSDDSGTAENVSGEADPHAQDLSDGQTDEVAEGYKGGVCEGMEWTVQPYNYQSATRRG